MARFEDCIRVRLGIRVEIVDWLWVGCDGLEGRQ